MAFEQSLLINVNKNISFSPYDCDVVNEYGCIRRSKVFKYYQEDLISDEDNLTLYVKWKDTTEYLLLRGVVIEPEFDYLYTFIKASKRGNDVYKDLVEKKLKPLKDLNNIEFFNEHSVNKKTRLLFLTLTYDTKLCNNKIAWFNIAKEYHLFLSNLLKQFGKIECFRAWESTNNFYPHIHVAILFKEYEFPVITHKDRDDKTRYRIPYSLKEKISKYWHSNVDIQALKSTGDCFRELTKYITKDLSSKKGDKTNSQIWIRRKQAYSVSRGFIEAVSGYSIDVKEPDNLDLIRNMCNCNSKVINWEFLGIGRGDMLGVSDNIWYYEMKKPPPDVLLVVENERVRWLQSHSSKYNEGGLLNSPKTNDGHKRFYKIKCQDCGSTKDVTNVLGVYVCKKCLNVTFDYRKEPSLDEGVKN